MCLHCRLTRYRVLARVATCSDKRAGSRCAPLSGEWLYCRSEYEQQHSAHHHEMPILGFVNHRLLPSAEVHCILFPWLNFKLDAWWLETQVFQISAHISRIAYVSALDADLPSLNYIDCTLFLSNDTEFGQKLKKVIALYYQIPLKQEQQQS